MDMKELMQQKGEIIAVSVSGLILVGYVVVAFGLSSDADLKTVQDDTTAATATLGSNAPPSLQKPDFAAFLTPWSPDAITKPDGKGGWVAMFKPKITARVKTSEGPKPPVEVPKTLLTPVIQPAETELGQVTVKWAEGKKPGTPAAAVTEWHVYRQEAGKDWTLLEKVPGMRKTCVDKAVEPKKKYVYKVKALTKDKTVDGKQESDFTATAEATIPSGVAIVYTGGSSSAAQLTVRKFMGGDWKEKKFTVIPKNEEKNLTGAIGKIEKERNPDSGKMEDVDYTTGFFLLEIRKDRFKFQRIERRSKIVEGVLEQEDVPVDAEKDRNKIIYLDDEGKQKEMWMFEKEDEEEPK
ncbi:MAG: hypothetical protein HYY18_15850 [Planctomycetes bacterium]|nr:hypothetical protein [Planctomycetota bacterium]